MPRGNKRTKAAGNAVTYLVDLFYNTNKNKDDKSKKKSKKRQRGGLCQVCLGVLVALLALSSLITWLLKTFTRPEPTSGTTRARARRRAYNTRYP
mmetsp:Transcript_13160/g.25005  ORF Transcript_13160/g.25005 Transcript_13160/m.25005 type:complete len:95 (+) Transcript_13160:84-368(+)